MVGDEVGLTFLLRIINILFTYLYENKYVVICVRLIGWGSKP